MDEFAKNKFQCNEPLGFVKSMTTFHFTSSIFMLLNFVKEDKKGLQLLFAGNA